MGQGDEFFAGGELGAFKYAELRFVAGAKFKAVVDPKAAKRKAEKAGK